MLIGSIVGLVIALAIVLSLSDKINWNYEVTLLLLLFYVAIGALIGTIIEAI